VLTDNFLSLHQNPVIFSQTRDWNIKFCIEIEFSKTKGIEKILIEKED